MVTTKHNQIIIITWFKGALSRQFCYILVTTAQIFDKESVFNMKLLVQHWEENTKVFLSEEQTIVIF